ncbi:uncharacterized protein FOBCDRAFT_201578 [Fusarium oxysporum Fo47]|uniref:uncharacterized protein n=1 Tax=Fusarium oxysporum Fo47 TaxID=660027 RepID=UPI0028698FAF|nr:uncharacterized protein FOBCDRAFT_201578 [Fusarium oxysporum Fo47]QKD54377.2 hypothetical protein FOBCDRAFT_201578 [Fusarium oxysporum Fo47]
MSDEQVILPIIDSHIHLYPASETDSLAWYTPDGPLAGQRSLEEYREATSSAPSLLGFVFVETDRKNDVESGASDGSGWEQPLAEVSWLKRVALGQPREGEGHSPEDAKLCLGIVPWAPLPSGPEVLERYLDRVKEEAGDAWPKIKGFRYLLQDKPHGTMLDDKFIEGVKLLGRRGFTFDVGIDQHRRGKKQLDEVIEFVDRVHDGVPEEEKVTLVLNPSFHAWRTAVYTLSKDSHVYMKLSGGFSEMPDSLRNQDPNHIFEATLGWLGIVLATFGPGRIMFGSDWPVCTVNTDNAWPRWRSIVDRMCWMATLSDEERAMIFGGTAKKAYDL